MTVDRNPGADRLTTSAPLRRGRVDYNGTLADMRTSDLVSYDRRKTNRRPTTRNQDRALPRKCQTEPL